MITLTLRQLEYFCAIVDEGSFHGAARASGVTQPGLSQQLAQLEEHLGVQLFERRGRGVFLTPAGDALLGRARAVLRGAEEIGEAAGAFTRPLCGPLRLGVIPTVAPYWLPRVLPEVRKRFPELQLLLREEQTALLVEALDAGELDLLLLALDAPIGDVATRELFRDAFVGLLPKDHRLAKRKRLRQEDLQGETVLLLDDGHCLREQALSLCQQHGAQEWGDFRATSLGTLVQMVESGAGITLLPEMAAPAETRSTPSAVIRPFTKPVPSRSIGLAWRRTSPRAAEFEALGEVLAGSAR